eukprot:CAMPEP_0172813486 /NCGR_PEP_ID=MMETSP1075-20121228/10692_1 /TAXON_ID=2916 /ORGANISM="Ceratium fusus, Strain PA161109" /LENGTH=78 /DNA_ID=CAMNT_0013653193 /DNA_START=107 /DNA_END=339 /DNA_ORIENTATION=-
MLSVSALLRCVVYDAKEPRSLCFVDLAAISVLPTPLVINVAIPVQIRWKTEQRLHTKRFSGLQRKSNNNDFQCLSCAA